jgi:peptidyl-prolyl cis-trans isomerase A (cyclophilin A)
MRTTAIPARHADRRRNGGRTPLAILAALALPGVVACGAGDRASTNPALLTPDAFTATAPPTFVARFETSSGDFLVEVVRDWAPHGADRFYNLVRSGYYDGVRFFRVVPGFMAQFGIHGDPDVNAVWRAQRIPDDRVVQSNQRGFLTFAMAGPDTRTTQVFINFVDNSRLDEMGFAPFGRVVEGMDVVDALHGGYGDGPPSGRGPEQARIQAEGNAYLARAFPDLDQVRRASILGEDPPG